MKVTGKHLFVLFVLIAVLQIGSLAALISESVPVWLAVVLKVSLFVAITLFFTMSWRWVRSRLVTT